MDSLKVTFANGETMVFSISPASTLSIETPDGPNGVERGVVSEVVNVEYEKDTAAVAVAPAVDASAETPQPDAAAAEPATDLASSDSATGDVADPAA